jgi:hypothetical protein
VRFFGATAVAAQDGATDKITDKNLTALF